MQRLNNVFKKIHNLEHAISILSWDDAVNMPSGGATSRAESTKELSLIIHDTLKDQKIADIFIELDETMGTRPEEEQAHYKEIKRVYQNENALPSDLISAQIMATSECEQKWRQYRKENNWNDFLPYFEEVLKLKKEEAAIRSEQMGLSPYDSLMNLFEPGSTSEQIDKLFTNLKSFLPDFLVTVLEKQQKMEITNPEGNFPISKQKELGLQIMKSLGFDFNHGRLDISHHPFCGGVADDVRLTTRYDEDDFTESLMGIIHETGHSLYEQNLPKAWRPYPVGAARSMGIHESQSIFYEMQVGRSNSFLKYILPILKNDFSKNVTNSTFWDEENFFNFYHKVERGLIRTSADEVTYPLHIIMRYELEKRMIEGRLEAKDLPEAWNVSMINYFDLDTKNNFRNGCMQDVHWYSGAFGYFPSYTLGAINAAQLFSSLEKGNPEIRSQISKGNLDEVANFLRKNIWKRGSFVSSNDLIKDATGEEMSAKYFKEHLESRYL